MKKLAKYKNGNYTVTIFDNGTKIRANNLDNLTPEFAESIDINISTKCDGHCDWCYLNCSENGKQADLNNPIFDTLHYGTEIALNANDLSHPDLENFLIRMKDKGVICNLTINQKHLHKNLYTLINWQENKLIWGLGISLVNSSDTQFILDIYKLKNVVIHVIDGLFTKTDLENLKEKNIKLLILGYKMVGKGISYYNQNKVSIESNINYLKENLFKYKSAFHGFGFDNLAVNHLEIQKQVSPDNWEMYHMGEEGEFTFFFDAVNNTYSISSMESDKVYPVKDTDTIDTMFHYIRRLIVNT